MEQRQSDPDRIVRLGVIGAGLAFKWLHWPALQRLADRFHIVAVADIVPEAAAEVAALVGGARTTTDYGDLLAADDVEAVLISLPIHLNAQVILESVRAGKHVICEKPIAANLAQGEEVVAALRGATVVVEIAENYHYRPEVQQARAWMADGRIGRPMLIDVVNYYWVDLEEGFGTTYWRQDSQYRGGAITDAAVHQAALLRELGGEVAQLQAFAKLIRPGMSGHDTLIVNLRFRGGALGRLLFSAGAAGAPPAPWMALVTGTEGSITLDRGVAVLHRPGAEPEEYRTPDGDQASFYAEFVNFWEAIVHGAPVVATPAEALRDLAILMRALDSAESRSVMLMR